MQAADIIVVQAGRVLLIKRLYQPFAGCWALPGGKVDPGEEFIQAAVRELGEETGIVCEAQDLQLVGEYDKPGRDPRGPMVSQAFLLLLQEPVTARAMDDAEQADWFSLDRLPNLAFDHAEILQDAIALLQSGQ